MLVAPSAVMSDVRWFGERQIPAAPITSLTFALQRSRQTRFSIWNIYGSTLFCLLLILQITARRIFRKRYRWTCSRGSQYIFRTLQPLSDAFITPFAVKARTSARFVNL